MKASTVFLLSLFWFTITLVFPNFSYWLYETLFGGKEAINFILVLTYSIASLVIMIFFLITGVVTFRIANDAREGKELVTDYWNELVDGIVNVLEG